MQAAFSFQLAGFPVFIGWSFLLVMGFGVAFLATQGSTLDAVALPAVFFVSILIHELGHALVARRLSLRPDHIVLHGLGGVTRMGRRPEPTEGILVTLAGPLAGLVLGTAAYLLFLVRALPDPVRGVLWLVAWLNLFWSLFNLLPIRPMDGGLILWHGLKLRFDGEQADMIARWVSVGAGLMVFLAALAAGSYTLAAVVAYVVFQSVQRAR